MSPVVSELTSHPFKGFTIIEQVDNDLYMDLQVNHLVCILVEHAREAGNMLLCAHMAAGKERPLLFQGAPCCLHHCTSALTASI
jgi:hypothetical protein